MKPTSRSCANRTWFLPVFGFAAAIGCLGCSTRYPSPVPVSGTVTVGGEAIDSGTLHFIPLDAKTSLRGTAKIESGGTFTAQTNKLNDGLTPGEFTVFIEPDMSSAGDNKKSEDNAIPDKYMTPKYTDLKVTIDGPETDLSVEFE